MKQRIPAIILCLILCISIITLSGCSKKGGSNQNATDKQTEEQTTPAPTTTTEKKEPVKIEVWITNPQNEKAYQAQVDAFMAKNENIDIMLNVLTHDQYYTQLNTAIQAKNGADVFYTHGNKTPNFVDLIKLGAIECLEGKLDVSAYDEKYLLDVMYEGKIYQAPAPFMNAVVMWYNKTLFEQNNLKPPATIDELINICDVLLKNNIIPFAYAGSDPIYHLFFTDFIVPGVAPDWLDAFTKGEAGHDSKEFMEAIKLQLEFGKKGYYGKDYMGVTFDGAVLSFAQEKAAMIVGGTDSGAYMQSNPDLKLGVFYMPMPGGGTCAMQSYDMSTFALNAYTKYKDEALAFIQWSIGDESNQILIDHLGLIPGPDFPNLKHPNPELIKEFNSNKRIGSNWFVVIGQRAKEGANPQNIYLEDIMNLFSGNLTVEQMTKNLAEATK